MYWQPPLFDGLCQTDLGIIAQRGGVIDLLACDVTLGAERRQTLQRDLRKI